MDQESLRLLIQREIRDERLPPHGIRRVWSSPSAEQTCDACDAIVSRDQLVMEGPLWRPAERPTRSTFGASRFGIPKDRTPVIEAEFRSAKHEVPPEALRLVISGEAIEIARQLRERAERTIRPKK